MERSRPRRAIPAIAVTTDTSFVTANANDVGFEHVLERQVEALGRAGDVLIGISTSGHSANIRIAFERARAQGIVIILLAVGEGRKLGPWRTSRFWSRAAIRHTFRKRTSPWRIVSA